MVSWNECIDHKRKRIKSILIMIDWEKSTKRSTYLGSVINPTMKLFISLYEISNQYSFSTKSVLN